MISFENSLLFWSVAILLSIVLFIFLGGVWVSIKSWLSDRDNEESVTALQEVSASPVFDVNEENVRMHQSAHHEEKTNESLQYLRRSARRRPV